MSIRRLVLLLVFTAASVGHAGDNRWTSNGPYGGDFSDFCFHPKKGNIVFAGGNVSGLFRSRDSGKTWQRLNVAGYGTLVRIHALDPRTILAVNQSVYRSTDEGSTWTLTGDWVFDGYSPSDLAFDPADPQVVYSATQLPGAPGDMRTKGVYRSTDGGKSWVARTNGLSYDCEDEPCESLALEVDSSDGDVLYTLTSGDSVYKTTDGGASWKGAFKGLDCGGGFLKALAIDPKNARTLYAGGECSLFTTKDGAQSWTAVTAFRPLNDLAIDPKKPTTIYAACGGIQKSLDGGATWTEILTSPVGGLRAIEVHPAKSSFVLAGGSGDGLWRTLNSGRKWELADKGLDAQAIDRIAIDPKDPKHLFAVAIGRLLYESRDRGSSWSISSLCRGDQHAGGVREVLIHPANHKLIVASIFSPRGALAVSTDGGATWDYRASDYCEAGALAADPTDQNLLYATLSGPLSVCGPLGIGVSTDQGRTWKLINSGLSEKTVSTIAVHPKNRSTLFAGAQNGKLFKTTNSGAKWAACKVDTKARIADIEFHPTDANTICIATPAEGTYRSTDGGRSWKTLSTHSSNFVTYDRSSARTIYSGGLNVWVSTDDGGSWAPFDSTGLAPFAILDLSLDPVDRNTLVLGTERGVFSYSRKGSPGGPVIEALVPAAGRVGDAVAIMGNGFGQVQGTSTIAFGTVAATVVQSWSDSNVKVAVPSGVQTGSVTVKVLGKKSNPYEFIVTPSSGSIEPTSGPASGGTRVTILAPEGVSGTEFNVIFGTALASDLRFIQPNIITCTSPPGTGTVEVKVSGTLTSTTVGTFTYQ